MHPRHRLANIRDPRQRVLAKRIGEVCDIFSEHFAALPPEQRLVELEGDTSDPWRKTIRVSALGMIIRLGRDLGLIGHDMHGTGARARTQIVELQGLHYASILHALVRFDALVADRSEVGRLVARRYSEIILSCLAELDATT